MKVKMNTKQKIIVLLVAVIVIVIVGGLYFIKHQPSTNSKPNSKVILFYGIGCPHCDKVEDFLRKTRGKREPLLKKEVYYDRVNARDLVIKAKRCGVVHNGMIAIPLLWESPNKCTTGDAPVVKRLQELGIK
jgi:hypothetical protein